MPNYCDVALRIKGKRWCVQKSIEWCEAYYSYNGKIACYRKIGGTTKKSSCHFYRIFDCWYDSGLLETKNRNQIVQIELTISCAWSFTKCFTDFRHTYYRDYHASHLKHYGKDCGISISKACRMLNVSAEAFSCEPGNAFSEHYVFDNKGRMLLEHVTDYIDLCPCDFLDYKEYVKRHKNRHVAFTEEEFDEAMQNNSCLIRCEHMRDGEYNWEYLK